MYVLCEYTERAILQMLSENKQREGILKPASMTIKYLKCRADLNFEVDFRSNGAISTVATW